MIGYDIDGVLTKGIKPKKPYVVISGRVISLWDKTIKEIGNNAPIYLRPYGERGDRILSGIWKAEMINKFGITKFYEDEEIQADIIKRYCPNCEVLIIKK